MNYDIFYIFASAEVVIGSPDMDDTLIVKMNFVEFKNFAADFAQHVAGSHKFYVKVDALTPAISYGVDRQDYKQ